MIDAGYSLLSTNVSVNSNDVVDTNRNRRLSRCCDVLRLHAYIAVVTQRHGYIEGVINAPLVSDCSLSQVRV